jgi:hypothetical protein
VDERRGRQLGHELGERALLRREQLEQLAERGDRVVGRQEAREDVAAARVSSGSEAGVRTTCSRSPITSSTWLVAVIGTTIFPFGCRERIRLR